VIGRLAGVVWPVYSVARASRAATACPRARARDERVAAERSRRRRFEGDEWIGWGGCGKMPVRC